MTQITSTNDMAAIALKINNPFKVRRNSCRYNAVREITKNKVRSVIASAIALVESPGTIAIAAELIAEAAVSLKTVFSRSFSIFPYQDNSLDCSYMVL